MVEGIAPMLAAVAFGPRFFVAIRE